MTHKKYRHILKHLRKISKYKKKEHCDILYRIHKKHGISKKTLFYIKEYGSKADVKNTIIKESLKVLILATVISSFGGFAIDSIKTIFLSLIPLVIMLPALNGMVGSYGTIFSSKFSTMIHLGKIKQNSLFNKHTKTLFIQVLIIAIITALISISIAILISSFTGFSMSYIVIEKIALIIMVDILILVSILFAISLFAGIYFYKKKEDPNNFLIPITTSVADFGNMLILAVLIIAIF